MSILAAAAAVPESTTVGQVAFAGGMIGVGMLIAYLLGVFRPGSVSGPIRPAPTTSSAGVLVLLVIAFMTWFGMQFLYGLARAMQHRASGNPEPFTAATFTPIDYSILATIPYVAGFLVLAIGDRFTKPTLPRELGWSLGHLPVGVGWATLAMLSVLPLMLGASIILEALYQAVGYQHPTEHELLTVLGRSREPATKVLIIGGATLLAPVFEEFLFRGHLQTLLVRAFTPLPQLPQGFQVVQRVQATSLQPASAPPAEAVAPPPEMIVPPAVEAPPGPSPAVRWAAIVITSLLFSVLHPAWTWPLIFLLSLALGYAYERTGNLWLPVVMHLVFNTFNTVLFLYTRPL